MEENAMTDFSRIKSLLGLNSSNGFSEDEIANMLNPLGSLPKILIDYYSELGNYDFNYWQDDLTKPTGEKFPWIYEYNYSIKNKYVIICCENQGVCFAGIKKEDLLQDNPPVYFSFDRKDWKLGCNNLFNYIHCFVYYNVVCCLDYNGYFEISNNGVNFIRSNFKNKNITVNNWGVDGKIEFYGDYDDTIIQLVSEGCLYYASNNKEHFIEMENKWKGIDMEYK
jgi:hypothetical protein